MKKTVQIMALFILLLQNFVSPMLVLAEEVTSSQPAKPIVLSTLVAELQDENNNKVNQVKAKSSYKLHLSGEIIKEADLEEALEIELSSNFKLLTESGTVINSEKEVIGQTKQIAQRVTLTIDKDVNGTQSFELDIPVEYLAPVDLTADTLTVTSVLGEEKIDFEVLVEKEEEPAKEEEIKEPAENNEGEKPATEKPVAELSENEKNKPTTASLNKRAPKEFTENLITDFSITITPDPENPTIESEILTKFSWALPKELRDELVAGDSFAFELPKELKINGPIASRELKND